MGLFDWLFGKKKKDQYGGNWESGGDVDPAIRAPRPQQRESNIQAPQAKQPGHRWHGLSWRSRRSKYGVSAVPDQTLNVSFWGGETSRLLSFGGTREENSNVGDPQRVEALGLPNLESFDELSDLLGQGRNDLLQYVVRTGESGHYLSKQVPKKSGGKRTLIIPLPRLKAIQRTLNRKMIRKLPLNDAVHGFRSCRDVLSGASVHVGREVVISLDIVNFFPSFDFRRVSGYFRSLGYSRGVAVALANLTTIRPCDVRGINWSMKTRRTELPQGAPTSPGIANAICWRMDKRLSALAQKFGGDYTRYADDLTFSGFSDMSRGAERLVETVRKIVETEGLVLNEKKTRIMRKGRQQRVTGVVVNEHTNVSRRDFDRLKAILHNCIKHGPHDQNREHVPDFEQHLRGRIAHVSHIGPERGRKLMRMFEQIRW